MDRDDEPRSYRMAMPMPVQVEESVRELKVTARQLRLIGPLVLLVTLGNIGILLWGIGRSVRVSYVGYQESLAILNIVIAMATIATLGLFETLRKRGDAIFQELSDELQWYVGRGKLSDRPPGFSDAPSRPTDTPTERPLLNARVTLRTFSAASELPLVPGRFGGAAYAAVNLTIAIASVFLLAG